jgi:hypothetical protein
MTGKIKQSDKRFTGILNADLRGRRSLSARFARTKIRAYLKQNTPKLMFSNFAPIKQLDTGEDDSMTIQTRVSQDRRNVSRVMSRLDCHFTFEGKRHEAVIINLSMKGAFVSSPFLPSNGSNIMVEIRQPGVKKDLIFDGTVTRGTLVNSDHGMLGRFGIRVGNAPIGLLALISKLHF